eukprot:363564-Chlamydomonas_euryale.AAC.5
MGSHTRAAREIELLQGGGRGQPQGRASGWEPLNPFQPALAAWMAMLRLATLPRRALYAARWAN